MNKAKVRVKCAFAIPDPQNRGQVRGPSKVFLVGHVLVEEGNQEDLVLDLSGHLQDVPDFIMFSQPDSGISYTSGTAADDGVLSLTGGKKELSEDDKKELDELSDAPGGYKSSKKKKKELNDYTPADVPSAGSQETDLQAGEPGEKPEDVEEKPEEIVYSFFAVGTGL